jgi:hypothetical protein
MANKYYRQKFESGLSVNMGRDKPDTSPSFDRKKVKKILGKHKSKPKNPNEYLTTGPMKGKPLGMPSVIKQIVKESLKFTKKNPKEVKKVLSDKEAIAGLTKKLKNFRKK